MTYTVPIRGLDGSLPFTLAPWLESTACSPGDNMDSDYPLMMEGGGSAPSENMLSYWKALKLCAGCPVRLACLSEGMRPENLTEGIWGGLFPSERAELAGVAPESIGIKGNLAGNVRSAYARRHAGQEIGELAA